MSPVYHLRLENCSLRRPFEAFGAPETFGGTRLDRPTAWTALISETLWSLWICFSLSCYYEYFKLMICSI